MTVDERAQVIEDIARSAVIRGRIVDQARMDKQFDIAAAWSDMAAFDKSINDRLAKARKF